MDTSGGSVFLSVVALNDEIVVILLWEQPRASVLRSEGKELWLHGRILLTVENNADGWPATLVFRTTIPYSLRKRDRYASE